MTTIETPTAPVSPAEAVARWAQAAAQARGQLGSFLDVGAYHGSLECVSLLQQGWTGVFIDPAPDAIARCAGHNLERGAVFCAALTHTSHKILGAGWTPDRPDTAIGQRPAGSVPIVAAGLHPSDLAELLVELRPPHYLSVDIGPGSLQLLELLCDWVPVDALRVTLPPDEAAAAAEWLSPWRGLSAVQAADNGPVTFVCDRTGTGTIMGSQPAGAHPPRGSM